MSVFLIGNNYDCSKLHADLQLTKAMLVDARAEIETILSEKKLLELNNAEMARKLELVSELLKVPSS